MSKPKTITLIVMAFLITVLGTSFNAPAVPAPPEIKPVQGNLRTSDGVTFDSNTLAIRTNSFITDLLHDWLGKRWFSEERPLLKFGVVSDIHVKPSDQIAQHKFSAMLRDMSDNLRANALVLVGDLGNGTPDDYASVRKLVAAQPKHPPLYFTIGNHEFYRAYHNIKTGAWSPNTFPNDETDNSAIQRFTSFIGKTQVYYDEYVFGYHFIFLGSEASAISNKHYLNKAYLSKEQLDWLRSKLKEDSIKPQPTFVFLHQPLPWTTSGSARSFPKSDVVQAQQLKEILVQHPEVILFTGHTHSQLGLLDNVYRGDFTSVNVSSVSIPKSARGKSLRTSSEGLFIEVYQNRVVIKGRDFTHNKWISQLTYVVRNF